MYPFRAVDMSSSYHMRPEQVAQNEDLMLTNSQGGASAPTTRPYAAVIPLIEADEERCHYCSKALAEYPLIQSDEAAQTVYHAACAVELATEILVDLFTSSAHLPHMSGCLCLPPTTQLLLSRP